MTEDEARGHFLCMLGKLRTMEPSPWPFLCASVLLEYLAKMALGSGRTNYIKFVKKYMSPRYSCYKFANGDKDLPEQLYYVLRCGMVHSFSLTPDKSHYNKARNESIVIAHTGTHLSRYISQNGHYNDAVCLVLGDLVNDIEEALNKLFEDAKADTKLSNSIKAHLGSNPPVAGVPIPAVPLPLLASAGAVIVSGSAHYP